MKSSFGFTAAKAGAFPEVFHCVGIPENYNILIE